VRHKWSGWSEDGSLRFETPDGEAHTIPSVVVLALGGGSWGRLDSPASRARGCGCTIKTIQLRL
jgi:predicted flavoprotein YhiN